jgi:hypothetical protein
LVANEARRATCAPRIERLLGIGGTDANDNPDEGAPAWRPWRSWWRPWWRSLAARGRAAISCASRCLVTCGGEISSSGQRLRRLWFASATRAHDVVVLEVAIIDIEAMLEGVVEAFQAVGEIAVDGHKL